MTDTHLLCSFFVGDLFLGLEVEIVQEVTGAVQLAAVPLAPASVCGLLNLRGQILTAIDLRRCLGLSDRPADQAPVNMILRTDDGGTSLLVDRVGDVVEVDEAFFEPPPETLRGPLRELIRGIYKLDASLLLALDAGKILSGITTIVPYRSEEIGCDAAQPTLVRTPLIGEGRC